MFPRKAELVTCRAELALIVYIQSDISVSETRSWHNQVISLYSSIFDLSNMRLTNRIDSVIFHTDLCMHDYSFLFLHTIKILFTITSVNISICVPICRKNNMIAISVLKIATGSKRPTLEVSWEHTVTAWFRRAVAGSCFLLLPIERNHSGAQWVLATIS